MVVKSMVKSSSHGIDSFSKKLEIDMNGTANASHITVAGCFQKFEFMDVLQLAETTCERFQEVDDFIDMETKTALDHLRYC